MICGGVQESNLVNRNSSIQAQLRNGTGTWRKAWSVYECDEDGRIGAVIHAHPACQGKGTCWFNMNMHGITISHSRCRMEACKTNTGTAEDEGTIKYKIGGEGGEAKETRFWPITAV